MDYPGKVITKTQVTPTQTSASGNWTLDDQAAAIKNNNWPVALVPNPISKSLRFNSADSAYLNRTLTTPTDGKKWTWSGWVKRGILTNGTGTAQQLFSAGSATAFFRFSSTDTLLSGWTGAANLETTQVFRDASAWYHIMLVVDTTQATASNRVKYYVNGSQITAFSSTDYPTQNSTTTINSAVAHNIGAYTSSQQYFNGYMTEINFIDGQALDPTSLGMTNPQTGQWIPKKYTGTYGTNGFYLNFKDATSTTTLGYDYSGNANNWTTNNFSVTAGSGNDSLTDVPTPWFAYNTTGDVGGVIRGNYATLNPLINPSADTFSNGNLQVTTSSSNYGTSVSTMATPTTGKWYAECTIVSTVGWPAVGICSTSSLFTATSWIGGLAISVAYYGQSGRYYKNTVSAIYGATYGANDIIGVAYDADNLQITFYKNGTTQGLITGVTAGTYYFGSSEDDVASGTQVWNFGQRPFAYTPPTGFRSLCTTNLPATAIGFGMTNQGDDYFNAVLYTGTGSPLSVTGVGFKPDWVWAKKRSAADDHVTSDALRGVQKDLTPNSTAAEATNTNGLQSFDTDGFSIGSGSGSGVWGGNSGATYVAWCWKASNAAGVTNTAGTITSTVSANTTAGFSVVTWTGTGSTGTVGHGLSSAPFFIIAKRRNASTNWQVYQKSLTASNQLCLNLAIASFSTTTWNSTEPTSSVFSIDNVELGANGATMVAYCFAAVAGYSAFGSYTGNGSADGPFVYLGFRPRFVMVKEATVSARDWIILDSARNTYNVADLQLMPNKSDAEATTVLSSTAYLDFVSNGFKVRNASVRNNENTATYIYAAFAESPFQFANAR